MTGTAGDEKRNECLLWEVNLLEILRGFDFDRTYIIIEWFRHCKMEHWPGSYCSFRYF